MIIKGNPAGNVGYWSKHLLRDDTNARAEVKEISGLLAEDLPSALREMQAIAAQSRSHGNFMYQANINPYDHEHLTPEQWKEAVDTLEKNLGLEGHQRVVVEHFKEGRQHYHVVWNRVDVDSLRVADMGGNYRIHTATARELESRFDLTPTPTQPAPDRKPALELWEVRAAERSGIDPAALKAELSALWRSTDSGKAFAAALDERGYILAKGDRRDFCVIDQAGDAHSLARRLDGVKAKDVRERMADVPRDSLPTVAEAREAQRTRPPLAHQPELEQTTVAPAAPAPKPQEKPSPEIAPAPEIARDAAQPTDQPPAASLGKTAGEIRILWNVSASAKSFAAALDERGMSLARVDGDEAAASQRAHAFARALGNYAPRYDEGQIVVVTSFGNVHKLNERTTGQTADAIEKRLGTLDPAALLNVTDTRAVMKEAARVEFYEQRQTARDLTPMEAKIQGLQGEAVSAGAFAAALYREGITIARADAGGIGGLARDQRAAFLDDRQFFAPTVKEGELVAVNRFGGVHRLNPYKLDLESVETVLTAGNRNIPALGYVREQIADDRAADQKIREERSAAFWSERTAQRAAKGEADQKQWRRDTDAELARVVDPVRAGGKSGLAVVDAVTGAAESLVDFVGGLLGGGDGRPPPDPATVDRVEQIKAQRRALAAMENIREAMERGERLSASDIQNLTPTHLQNIARNGDDYLRNLIERMERDRAREHEWGRERER